MPDLFLDLDGVLADFDGEVKRRWGARADDFDDDDLWARIAAAPGFFAELPPMPDALEIWAAVRELRPTILTGAPWSVPTAEADKVAWCARVLGADVPVIVCKAREKAKHCTPGAVIVDDRPRYRALWEGAGGVWIHHVSAKRSIAELIFAGLLTPPPVDRRNQTTTDGRSAADVRAEQIAEGNRLHRSYIVLTDAERAKGFVRPVRESYKHVGKRPAHPTRDLNEEEIANGYDKPDVGFVKFETYPPDESERQRSPGRYWTAAELRSGCGGVTTMSRSIAETYARDPSFYGSTYCTTCHEHYPVGADGEFVWIEAGFVTELRVGT